MKTLFVLIILSTCYLTKYLSTTLIINTIQDYTVYNEIVSTINFENKFEIYPNPTIDVLTINFKNEIVEGLKIYNEEGRIIKNLNQNLVGLTKLDLSDFTKGIYFLEITFNKKSYVEKVVLK